MNNLTALSDWVGTSTQLLHFTETATVTQAAIQGEFETNKTRDFYLKQKFWYLVQLLKIPMYVST